MKRDCGIVATADALVVLGDPAPWARLLRYARDAGIPVHGIAGSAVRAAILGWRYR